MFMKQNIVHGTYYVTSYGAENTMYYLLFAIELISRHEAIVNRFLDFVKYAVTSLDFSHFIKGASRKFVHYYVYQFP